MNQIKDIKKYTYRIILLSGLHIGGSQGGMKIGGIDSAVVKNPLNGMPYIPGSSIKGKMRALLEMKKGQCSEKNIENSKTGEIKKEYNACDDSNKECAKYLGYTNKNSHGSSKIIFSDFLLDTNDKKLETFINEDGTIKSSFFEDKSENMVPRFDSGNAVPRHLERVPQGVSFLGTISIILDGETDEKDIKKFLDEGIELLERTYLGGGGSRGNGRVEIEEIKE